MTMENTIEIVEAPATIADKVAAAPVVELLDSEMAWVGGGCFIGSTI